MLPWNRVVLVVMVSLVWLALTGCGGGESVYVYPDGSEYVGPIKDGLPNGQGTWTHPNGNRYVGEFKDALFSGQGTLIYTDGDKYVGEFKDDLFHGQGIYTYADGRKYVGEFKDGFFHGQGTFTTADDDKYVGEFKDDLFHGQGTYVHADGDKYTGSFREGKMHGQGRWVKTDGSEYTGEFKDDMAYGQGRWTCPDGGGHVGEFIKFMKGERPGEVAADKLSPEDNEATPRERQWIEVVVPVGENPPYPDQVGADYAPDPLHVWTIVGVIWELELALFGERWNEAAAGLDRPDLYLEEFVVRYQDDEMYFYQDMAGLRLWGEISYQDRWLHGAGVYWERPDASGDKLISSSWEALVYATDPEIMMKGQIAIPLEGLGLKGRTPAELVGHSSKFNLELNLWELWYEFYAEENWGEFMVGDKDWSP